MPGPDPRPRSLPFSSREMFVGATVAAAAIAADTELRASMRAKITEACASAGLPVPPVERQDQIFALALDTILGPLPDKG